MATGGKDDNDKFTGNCKDKSEQNGEDENPNKSLIAEPESSEENKKSTNRDENPFSFKKFLKASEGHQTNGFRATPNRIINLDLANDLPDFVQGRYGSSDCDSIRSISNPVDNNLPDFALHDSNKSLGARPKVYNRVLPMFSNNINSSNINAENHEEARVPSHPANVTDSCSNSLPDFLSDSGIGPTCIRESTSSNSDMLVSLKSHNAELLKRIDDLTQSLDVERDRNHRLTQRLNRMKTEEMVTLDKILPQALTCARDNQANENGSDQLISQMKLLQDQVETLQAQQNTCTCTKNSRQQLVQAAQKVTTVAGQVQLHLRNLMMSLDELKLASEVVASCSTSLPPSTGCPPPAPHSSPH